MGAIPFGFNSTSTNLEMGKLYNKHDQYLQISKVFGRTKLHKKGSKNICIFLLNKVIMILR